MRDNILLKVNGLTKSYGDRVVLENIDTEIRKGSGCNHRTFRLRQIYVFKKFKSNGRDFIGQYLV